MAILALAGCSSSGGGSAGSSLPATTTTVSAVTTTTTVVATTAAPTTTTSTVVQDATKADPKVLAQQLQAVLDRFRSLYVQSRTDPNLPFESQELQDELLTVVTRDYLGLSLIPAWEDYRSKGTTVRNGPSGPIRDYLTKVTAASAERVEAEYCNYDDGTTIEASDRRRVG